MATIRLVGRKNSNQIKRNEKALKIIFLSDYLPNNEKVGGGLQNYTYRTALALTEQGEAVTVITKFNNDSVNSEFPFKNFSINIKPNKVVSFLNKITKHHIEGTLNLILEAKAFQKTIEDLGQFDVLQSPNYQYPALFVRKKYEKIVVRASSYRPLWLESKHLDINTRLGITMENILYRRADAIIAPSQYIANVLSKKFNKKVSVIPTPIPETSNEEDQSWYQDKLQGVNYILFFGTMLKRKGLFVLAEAMKQVWLVHPEVKLVLIGHDSKVDGKSVLEEAKNIMGEANGERIKHFGNLDHIKLWPVIKQSRFVVMPSLEDNCPNTMLEAMALGKVVLGTYGSSMDEFYPKSALRLLVDKGNVDQLANKIIELWELKDEELADYGGQLREFVETNHNPDLCARKLRDFYASL